MSRPRRPRRHPRGMAWTPPEEDTGYDGDATLIVDDQPIAVTVHLDGHLEPLDGLFHWYGRIDRSTAVAGVKDRGVRTAALVIGAGEPAEARLAEYDPWGHIQVNGTGRPPYPMEQVEVELPVDVTS